jgi:hypothetical protein
MCGPGMLSWWYCLYTSLLKKIASDKFVVCSLFCSPLIKITIVNMLMPVKQNSLTHIRVLLRYWYSLTAAVWPNLTRRFGYLTGDNDHKGWDGLFQHYRLPPFIPPGSSTALSWGLAGPRTVYTHPTQQNNLVIIITMINLLMQVNWRGLHIWEPYWYSMIAAFWPTQLASPGIATNSSLNNCGRDPFVVF